MGWVETSVEWDGRTLKGWRMEGGGVEMWVGWVEESVGWVDGGWSLEDGCVNGGTGDCGHLSPDGYGRVGWRSGLDGDVGLMVDT